jgi:hypothetical protein
MTSPVLNLPSPEIKPFDLTFFDCTLTTIRAGFRRPTRTSSESASASVMVALKSPVRRCFGRQVRIRVNAAWNPKSSNLNCSHRCYDSCLCFPIETGAHRSASSSTNISNSLTLIIFLLLPRRNSSTRPGVPITMSAPVVMKR